MYDWVNIPLVYTQLVSIAVWSYFTAGLVAMQWMDSTSTLIDEPPIDLYVPLFTVAQFICLVAWLRVAQDMLNPFGEKDDDLELNYCIDRNLQLGLLIADELHGTCPELRPDEFAEEDVPEIPHTAASKAFAGEGWVNSAARLSFGPEGMGPTSPTPSLSRAGSLHSIRSKLSALPSRLARSASGRSSLRRLSRAVSRSSSRSSLRSMALDPAHHGDFHPMETLTEEAGEARKTTTASATLALPLQIDPASLPSATAASSSSDNT